MKIVSLQDLPEITTTHSGVGKKKVLIGSNTVKNLHQFGHVVFQKGEAVTPHSHADFTEVMWVESGNALMKIDQKEFEIKQGDCITVEPNEIHSIIVHKSEPLTLLFFGIYSK